MQDSLHHAGTLLNTTTPRERLQAEDTLLVYYSGHGVPLPRDGSLHLAVRTTDRRRLHATAVPIEWIRAALAESHARSKVVILDCCFSGRAIQAMSAGALAEEVDVAGSFVMTAASANTKAVAPEGQPFTAFTGAVIDVLTNGLPDAGPYLSLDSVFVGAKKALRARGFPEPQSQRMNEAARLALARNPATGPLKATVEFTPITVSAASHDGQGLTINVEMMSVTGGPATIHPFGAFDESRDAPQRYWVELFAISRHPITVLQYGVFLDARDGYGWDDWWRGSSVGGEHGPRAKPDDLRAGDHANAPVTVRRSEALAFCRWFTMRAPARYVVPSAMHWVRAAQGDTGFRYPWGNEFEPDACNDRYPLIVTPVDQYPNSASVFGVEDLVGNAPEWVVLSGDVRSYDVTGEFHIRGAVAAKSDRHRYTCDYAGETWPPSPDARAGFRVATMSQVRHFTE